MGVFFILIFSLEIKICLAGRTGLEPATSAVTGRHSNQLNYRPNRQIYIYLATI